MGGTEGGTSSLSHNACVQPMSAKGHMHRLNQGWGE